MRPKIISENDEFLFVVVECDGVSCAARYHKKSGGYVDTDPCNCYQSAVKRCKAGARGKWFD